MTKSSNSYNNNKTNFQNNKELRIIAWNCLSFPKRKVEFLNFISTQNYPDIIILNETKVKQIEGEKILKVPGYITLLKSRNNSNRGGGCALLIKDHIQFASTNELDHLNLEICTIKINIDNRIILVIGYYNPAGKIVSKDLFNYLEMNNLSYIIGGDLNSKTHSIGCKGQNKSGEMLDSILSEFNSQVVYNTQPTHRNLITKEEDILDLFVISSDNYRLAHEFKVHKDFDMTSDHYPIELKLNASNLLLNNNKNKFNYNLAKADWNKYKSNLPSFVPSEYLTSPDSLNAFITESILKAADQSIPIKNNKYNNNLPQYIVDLIKLRRQAKNRAFKTKNLKDKQRANLLTKLVRDEIAANENQEWQSFIEKHKHNPLKSRPFWQKIKKANNKEDSASSTIPTLTHLDKKIEGDLDKANLFSSILRCTFSDSNDEKFDSKFKDTINEKVNNYLKNNAPSGNLFSITELNHALKQLRSKTTPGQDKIHNSFLKEASDEFKFIILDLCNMTIRKNELPTKWKESMITMINKKVINSSNPKDYRPISLTSCLAKLCEKLIARKINDFLTKEKIIIKQQSGFRSFRQTKDNLIHLTQKIYESFNRRKRVFAIFFDIQAAFDKVWHVGLISKMIDCKFPSFLIHWVFQFLSDRSFTVRINSSISEPQPISTGVPQGSVLSPILFSIFINDIPIEHKKNKSYSHLFADDLVTYFIFRRNNNVKNSIRIYLSKIELWLSKWRLIMAPEKCNYIVFSKTPQVHKKLENKKIPIINKNEQFDVKLFKKDVPSCTSIKFLGVILDKKLNFNEHIEEIKKKCINRLNIIKIVSHKSWHLNHNTLIQLYKSLVRSIMEYSSFILPYIKHTIYKLESIQNAALRAILKQSYDTPVEQLHKQANLEPLKFRLDQLNLRFLSNTITNKHELIHPLFNEYANYVQNRNPKYSTIFCENFSILKTLI
jgi:exonuclease III